MKLGTKIFSNMTIYFSILFLLGGYFIISLFNKTNMEREITNAVKQYEDNKFILQAAIVTRGTDWFQRVIDGECDGSSITADMENTVAVYSIDGKKIYSAFPEEVDVTKLLSEIQLNKVNYRFTEIADRKYIMTAGMVYEKKTKIYLVTGVDINRMFEQQRDMAKKFELIYVIAILSALIFICYHSIMLVRPIKRLTIAAKNMIASNYQEKIPVKKDNDFSELARYYNQMAVVIEQEDKKLVDFSKIQEDFISNFNKEIKTPLTSIIGNADRICEKELSREEQQKIVKTIVSDGKHLENLFQEMKDLADIQAKEYGLLRMDTYPLLQKIMEEVSPDLTKRQVEVTSDVQNASVMVEYDLLRLLFHHLIENALNAGAKHLQIRGKVIEDQDEKKESYVIQLIDDGEGISEEDIPRITEAFYIGRKPNLQIQHGAGLGLTIADKIAGIHGSRLRFISSQGWGTTVSLQLALKGDDVQDEK